MPLGFSYGINMDEPAMQARCPRSRMIGVAQLASYRFFIMDSGYASVTPARGSCVHGLVWQLALSDVASLDRFEEVGRLYRKALLPVLTTAGPRQALVYLGLSAREGGAHPGYMEAVLAAAERCGLPASYRTELHRWLPQRRRGPTVPPQTLGARPSQV